jgi:hypothetical protein
MSILATSYSSSSTSSTPSGSNDIEMANNIPVELKIAKLESWPDIVTRLGKFSPQTLEKDIDEDGEVSEPNWIFRGVGNHGYDLQPSIERSAGNSDLGWAGLEKQILNEYRCRAGVQLRQPGSAEDEITWLAQMQHYGIPTRLLDFTVSPYIALYFAIRQSRARPKWPKQKTYMRVWAIDEQAIRDRSQAIAVEARNKCRESRGEKIPRRLASLTPALSSDVIKEEITARRKLAEDAISGTEIFRRYLNQRGFICIVSPGSFNARLASQQGLFLLNGAEKFTFAQSLRMMMNGQENYQQAFDVPADMAPECEKQLFQMNIHEQSLFPDVEGLAGLIRQQVELYWVRQRKTSNTHPETTALVDKLLQSASPFGAFALGIICATAWAKNPQQEIPRSLFEAAQKCKSFGETERVMETLSLCGLG